MAGIYIYSDHGPLAAELISTAKQTGKEAKAVVFSAEAAEAVKNAGADKIFVLKGVSPIAENYGKALAEFLSREGAELFLVGATARGRDLAARTAGYLDCGMASDVSSLACVDGKVITERVIYGGVMVQKEALAGFSVVTMAAGKAEPLTGAAEIMTVDVAADRRVSLVETAAIVKKGVDLREADKVVCVGMGMDKEEDMQIARDLAAALGAELGCTRGIAEERHWLPAEQYIGISGAMIKPQLYLSMGVSGQVQHTIGIRDAKIIVAVNSNEKAPVFKICDYGIVGNLYEIIPLLSAELKG